MNALPEFIKDFHTKINKEKVKVQAKIVKKSESEDQRLFYAVVLEPMTEVTDSGDAHGDIMSSEEITKSAHYYMEMGSTIFKGHKAKIDAAVVESFIAPIDFIPEEGEDKILKGSWVMGVKVFDDDVWQDIKDGNITAFSPGGYGKRLETD